MAKGDAGRLEVTVVGARGLSASRTARVELVHGGGRRVRTRPAPRGLVSSPQQLVEFGDWFSFPLDGEILALTVVGTRVGGKEVTLGAGELQVSPLLTGQQEQASCSLLSIVKDASEFAGEVLVAVKFCPPTGAPAVGIRVSLPGAGEARGHPVEPAAAQLGRAVERDIAELQSALEAVRLEAAGQQANQSQATDAQDAFAGFKSEMSSEIERLAARISALEAERDDFDAEDAEDAGNVWMGYHTAPHGGCEDWDYFSSDSEDSESDEDLSGLPMAARNAQKAKLAGLTTTEHPVESFREGSVDFWPTEWEFNPEDGFCGRRVRVLWKPNERRMQASGKSSRTCHSQWWGGFIAAMLPFQEGSMARIHYDDGDIECLDLSDGSSQWEFTAFGPGDVGRRLEVANPNGGVRTGTVEQCVRKRLPHFKLPTPVGPEDAHPAEEMCRNSNGRFVSDAALVLFDRPSVLFDGCNVSEPLNLEQENFRWLDQTRRVKESMVLDLIDTKVEGPDKAAWRRARVREAFDSCDGMQRVELAWDDNGECETKFLSGEFPGERHQWRALETPSA